MNFLDRSGHIFTLQSFPYEPIGQEYDENDYVFWIDSKKLDKLSINNYYTRTIYLVVPFEPEDGKSFNELVNIEITIDSNKFWLLSSTDIQDFINKEQSIDDYIYNINDSTKLKKISNVIKPNPGENEINDGMFAVIFDENDEELSMTPEENKSYIKWPASHIALIPIYVLCNSNVEGTWLTNILIHVYNNKSNAVDEDWCSITVGGEFCDENEILTINGLNTGIKLPKSMFRAIYQCSFINNEFNEQIYNEKLKEYLMNYMEIKGQKGNFNSAINSLKWFGYGDHITIVKLFKTDNEIKDQYLRDNFDINYDILKSFKYFRNSTYISLYLHENEENGNVDLQEFYTSYLMPWGESTPELVNLFEQSVEVKYDYDNEKYKYIKQYYDFTMYEMGLKLSCLKYYYEKYFLPIYLKVHSIGIEHKVYANPIKMKNESYNVHITEHNIEMFNKHSQVEFENEKYKYFTHQIHYVDAKFNEWKETDILKLEESTGKYYEINDVCLNIPIKFKNNTYRLDENTVIEFPTYFNCVLILEKENDIYSSSIPYYMHINKNLNILDHDIIIYNIDTKLPEDLNIYQFAYSQDNKNWSLWTIGYDNFKSYIKKSFEYKIFTDEYDNVTIDSNLELRIIDGKIEYYINTELVNINEESLLTLKDLTNENEIKLEEVPDERIINYNDETWYVRIPSIYELNTNVMNINDSYTYVECIPPLYISMKYNNTEIYDVKYNNKSIKDNVNINFVNDTSVIYESHFSFVQDPNDYRCNLSSVYNSFVIYPQLMNNQGIDFYINKKFKLKLCVNNRWYEYEFETKMPDIELEFGTLEYKYYQDNIFKSRFEQLLDLTDDSVMFNSFMNEPKLVEVNDVRYLENLEQYIIKNNIKILDDKTFSKINSSYIIISLSDYVHIKIFFNKNLLDSINSQTMIIYEQVIKDALRLNMFESSIYVLNEELMFYKTVLKLPGENNNDVQSVWEREFFYRDKTNHSIQKSFYYKGSDITNEIGNIIIKKDENDNIYVKIGESEIFEKVKVYDGYFFIDNKNRFLNNFNIDTNLTSNKKFLNNIALYDIYEKTIFETQINSIMYNSNIKLSCNGVTFEQNVPDTVGPVNFISKRNEIIQLDKKSGIVMHGTPLWDNDVLSNDIDYYSDFTNFDITLGDTDIYDADHNRYDIEGLENKYPGIDKPVTEAHLFESVNTEQYFYYWFEDFTGKRYYSLSSYNVNKVNDIINDDYNIANFIDDASGPILDKTDSQKLGYENTKIATLYFDTFDKFFTYNDKDNPSYSDCEFTNKNNYYAENTKLYKVQNESNAIIFNMEHTTGDNVYVFNAENSIIKYKIYYVRVTLSPDNKPIYTKIDNESTGMSVAEKISVLQSKYISDIRIAADVFLDVNNISDFFVVNGKELGSYSSPVNSTILDLNSSTIKPLLIAYDFTDEMISQYITMGYKGIIVDMVVNNVQKQIPVIVKPIVEDTYINYHNNEYVYNYQPGVYIYDLTNIDYNKLHNEIKNILTNSHLEYAKYVINLDDKNGTYEDTLNSLYTHVNPFDENKTRINDYNFKYENLYVFKSINNLPGTYHIDFELEKIDESEESNESNSYVYYTFEELKTMTSLLIQHKKYNDDSSYTNEIFELLYTDDPLDLKIDNPKDELEIIIKIKIDEENRNIHGRQTDESSIGRKIIPKFIIYPIITRYSEHFTKLKYDESYIDGENVNKDLESIINNAVLDSEINKYVIKNQKTVDLYNNFFEKQYIYRDKNNDIEILDTSIYNIERIYQLEKQYNIWSKDYMIQEIANVEPYVLIMYEEKPDEIIPHNYALYDKSGNRIDMNDIIIDHGYDAYEILWHNFVIFTKYLYSVKYEKDFYKCDIYDENNKKILLDDYSFSDNYYEYISPKVNIESYLDYDMYLMHDMEYWYTIFISKDTISKIDDPLKQNLLDGHKILKCKNSDNIDDDQYDIIKDEDDNIVMVKNKFFYNSTDYELRYVKANNDFLINRMKFIPKENSNIFDKNDIVVFNIKTNDVIPVNIMHSAKWNIMPMSYGMHTNVKLESNSEMTIFPYSQNMTHYESGFYDINIRYCLDKNAQHQYMNRAILRIK